MNKKATKMSGLALVLVLFVAVGVIGGGIYLGITYSAKAGVTPEESESDAIELESCPGLASVTIGCEDTDAYKTATDPSGHCTIYEKNGDSYAVTIADDATSAEEPKSDWKGIIGNNAGTPSTTYFSKLWEGSTGCSNIIIGIKEDYKLNKATAPTITVVNSNGFTVNSNANSEEVANSTGYTPKFLVKSASDACAAEYGAIVAIEYDDSHTTKWDAPDLSTTNVPDFEKAHATVGNSTNDRYSTFLWMGTGSKVDEGQGAGMLCDGAEETIYLEYETRTIVVGTQDIDINIHWYPLNIDLDADSYEVLEGIAYDEDDNLVSVAYSTTVYHVNKA